MCKKIIKQILKDLYKHKDKLAGDKFSGVHYADGVYRVHSGSFIPKIYFSLSSNIYKHVDTEAKEFGDKMYWDVFSLWLTMFDEKDVA